MVIMAVLKSLIVIHILIFIVLTVESNANSLTVQNKLEQEKTDSVTVPNEDVSCPGCPQFLNKTDKIAYELLLTALRHIESERKYKHIIIYIRKLQQQVVAGMKYILVIDVAQTICKNDSDSRICPIDLSVEPLICEVQFLEQSWIRKGKHIIKNNCTQSQEFEPYDESTRIAFNKFLAKYNKKYQDDREYNYRLNVFRHNLAKIEKLNKEAHGTVIYGINEFADLTDEEFSQLYGYKPNLRNKRGLSFAHTQILQIQLPTGLDCRIKDTTPMVKKDTIEHIEMIEHTI
ncbi:hypothetical protein ABEB36_013624 [Hypothenemus hampei]|uniref:Cystatin domain-containing protein n=1 Tax=Hypothenemus hampei TaxID=57062 RepID=A0ABD1E4R5_HYPHA